MNQDDLNASIVNLVHWQDSRREHIRHDQPDPGRPEMDLSGQDLHRLNFEPGDGRVCRYFDGTNFRGADLQGARLRNLSLYQADLRDANLHGVHLRRADLGSTDLRGADLRGADLRRAELDGTDLRTADLRGANLKGADLRGANLHGTQLDPNTLQSAILDGESTMWERVKDRTISRLARHDAAVLALHERGELTVMEKVGKAWERGVAEPSSRLMDWIEEKRSGPGLPDLPTPRPFASEQPPRRDDRRTASVQAPTPAPQRAAVQEAPTPQNGPPPPGWSHEEIAQNKALAQEISEIKNPERRADAERLLAGIKAETEALQPRRQREQGLELEP